MLLRVAASTEAAGIWEIEEPGSRYSGGFYGHRLPGISDGLAARFEMWGRWNSSTNVINRRGEQYDVELFKAYGLALAIDLKHELGDDYYIEFGAREIHDDLKFLREANEIS